MTYDETRAESRLDNEKTRPKRGPGQKEDPPIEKSRAKRRPNHREGQAKGKT